MFSLAMRFLPVGAYVSVLRSWPLATSVHGSQNGGLESIDLVGIFWTLRGVSLANLGNIGGKILGQFVGTKILKSSGTIYF